MEKVTTRQTQSSSYQWSSNDQERSFQKSLNPRMDRDGIVKCYRRLRNFNLSEKIITLILLPRRERFVQLLIEDIYKQSFHSGVNDTLSKLTGRYWIEKGIAEVKYVLRRCKIC